VVLNAMDAAEHGAEILPQTKLTAARRHNNHWQATLEPTAPGAGPVQQVAARALVNAAGPWVLEVQDKVPGAKKGSGLRLVKGSHIVVPRIAPGTQAYIFQNPDRRIVFAIPYERDFTRIGTTELPYTGDPGAVAIAEDETAYLCEAVSRYFAKPVTPEDVIFSFETLMAKGHPYFRSYWGNVEKAEKVADRRVKFTFGGDTNHELPLIIGQMQVLPSTIGKAATSRRRRWSRRWAAAPTRSPRSIRGA